MLLAKLQALDAAFDADPEGFMKATTELTGDEYRLVGRLIQLYCFADYCARRSIDAVREAALGPDKRNASVLKDAQVFPKLREAALMLWECDLRDALVRAADILVMHYQMRHNFAHWAARRIPKENAIIILSKNATEGRRRHGLQTDEYVSNYGLFSVTTLTEEMKKLDQHVHNLSVAAYELEHRVDEMRMNFDQRGMHPRKMAKR